MGNSPSTPPGPPADALICKYNKSDFNNTLKIIRDAHDVSNFYADKLLLGGNLPLNLDEYKNYSALSENYFVPTRKVVLPDLGESYYNFYQYLQNTIKTQYESPNNKDDDRRKVIEEVFKKCYIVQKYIIEDLWESCNNAPASNKKVYPIIDNDPWSTIPTPPSP